MSSRRISKVVWLCVWLALGYAVWHSAQSYRAREFAKKQAAASKAAAQKESILAMAGRNAADVHWAKQLSGSESTRISPLQSAELQALWLPDRAILFLGRVENIANAPNPTGGLVLRVVYDGFTHGYSFLGTRLQLQVDCAAPVAEGILRTITASDYFAISADVALVAKIDAVSEFEAVDHDGTRERGIRGTGTCIEAKHLPEGVLFDLSAP